MWWAPPKNAPNATCTQDFIITLGVQEVASRTSNMHVRAIQRVTTYSWKWCVMHNVHGRTNSALRSSFTLLVVSGTTTEKKDKERHRNGFRRENLRQHAWYEELSHKTRALHFDGQALWFDTNIYKIKSAWRRWEDLKDDFFSSSRPMDIWPWPWQMGKMAVTSSDDQQVQRNIQFLVPYGAS